MSVIIDKIVCREILDSRGNPTVEAEIYSKCGAVGRAAVPSGASTGKFEACELRDGDQNRYMGKGVTQALANVNGPIQEAVRGMDASEQSKLDQTMLDLDGTKQKTKLGANAILAVSMAATKLAATAKGVSLYKHLRKLYEEKGGSTPMRLPVPLMNVLNGGDHANNSVDIQEIMVVPHKADSFSDALRKGTEIFHHLKKILHKQGQSTAVGDEGGFAPNFGSNKEAIEAVLGAIKAAGYTPGKEVALALDVAASSFFKDGAYHLASEGKKLTSAQMQEQLKEYAGVFPIISIEDGLDEEDWDGFHQLTKAIGDKVQIVGDDLFVTSPEKLTKGIEQKAGNSILIKLNQIGTVSETLSAVQLAEKAGWGAIVSHRSGETEDTFIADLSVAVGCGQIKTGSASRSDRVAKYNQLLRIEEELGESGGFNWPRTLS
jgi:enolase